jgi:hypothetical protein
MKKRLFAAQQHEAVGEEVEASASCVTRILCNTPGRAPEPNRPEPVARCLLPVVPHVPRARVSATQLLRQYLYFFLWVPAAASVFVLLYW